MRMNKTNYKQYDVRFAKLPFPKAPHYIKDCGCGEVAICNAIIEMDEYMNETPKTILSYCKQFAASNGDGLFWSAPPIMMTHYGMTEVKEHATMSTLWKELEKGDRVAFYIMDNDLGGSKKVRWTKGKHCVVSVAYKFENGKHYVYMKDSNSSSDLRNGWISYEECFRNSVFKVWSGKLKTIEATDYRPSTPYTGTLPTKTVKDGVKGEAARACQIFLNWCINAGLSTDGNCGRKTVKAIKIYQKTYGLTPDGKFGKASRTKAEEIIKEHDNTPKPYSGEYPDTKVGRGPDVAARAKEYAWPEGTASSKSDYEDGAPKDSYKAALKKYMGKTEKISLSDCGYFVSTVVRSLGISSTFLALPGEYKDKYPAVPSGLSIVHKGEIGSFKLEPGDIIRYRKKSGQHTLLYIGGGLIAHAGRGHWFPKVVKSAPWNNDNVKQSTIQVIRANSRNYLKRGDEGEEVKKLQKYINWFFYPKYGKDVLTVDGKYGPATEGYCKLMQSDLGFTDCDGFVGPKTVEAMKGWKQ